MEILLPIDGTQTDCYCVKLKWVIGSDERCAGIAKNIFQGEKNQLMILRCKNPVFMFKYNASNGYQAAMGSSSACCIFCSGAINYFVFVFRSAVPSPVFVFYNIFFIKSIGFLLFTMDFLLNFLIFAHEEWERKKEQKWYEWEIKIRG